MRAMQLVPTVAAAAVLAMTVALGNWQLRRADEKLALQQARQVAERAAPVPIGAAPLEPQAVDGQRVSITGRWVPQRTVFLDNRTHAGRAGFYVFTPLRLDGEPAMHVLVLRGWVARDPLERTRLPAVRTPEGVVRIEGLAQARFENALQLGEAARLREGPDARIWQAVTLPEFAAWSQLTLQPFLVRQTAEGSEGADVGGAGAQDDGLLRDWPQPGSGVDKHRAYAVQWYAMAAATALLWLYFGVFKRHGSSDPDQ